MNGGRDDFLRKEFLLWRPAWLYWPSSSGTAIIGRMGIPYHQRRVNVISVAMDAPADVISALSGKIGRLPGITAKTVYAPEEALK